MTCIDRISVDACSPKKTLKAFLSTGRLFVLLNICHILIFFRIYIIINILLTIYGLLHKKEVENNESRW